MAITGTVYGVFDPRDSRICIYIGQTTTPLARRMSRHIASAMAGRASPFWSWLRTGIGCHGAWWTLIARPLLERVPLDQLDEYEMSMIVRYAAIGHPLLNRGAR